jgi:hypothetical protein
MSMCTPINGATNIIIAVIAIVAATPAQISLTEIPFIEHLLP